MYVLYILIELSIVGTYLSGPIWGRIVDRKGPQILLACASICLFIGYLGIRQMYDDCMVDASTVSPLRFALLVGCSFMTGSGGSAGLSAAMNATAKSFSSSSVRGFFPSFSFVRSTDSQRSSARHNHCPGYVGFWAFRFLLFPAFKHHLSRRCICPSANPRHWNGDPDANRAACHQASPSSFDKFGRAERIRDRGLRSHSE